MDLLVESVLAIDEENVETLSTEQACTLKPGKSGADDSHVVARSHETYPPGALFSKAGSPKKAETGRHLVQESYASRKILVKYFARQRGFFPGTRQLEGKMK